MHCSTFINGQSSQELIEVSFQYQRDRASQQSSDVFNAIPATIFVYLSPGIGILNKYNVSLEQNVQRIFNVDFKYFFEEQENTLTYKPNYIEALMNASIY